MHHTMLVVFVCLSSLSFYIAALSPVCPITHFVICVYELLQHSCKCAFDQRPDSDTPSSQFSIAGNLASMLLRTRRYISKLALQPALPKLFVLGDSDQFSSTKSLAQAVQSMDQQTANSQQSHESLGTQAQATSIVKVMPGCDHFFVHQRRELALCVLQFCLDHQS